MNSRRQAEEDGESARGKRPAESGVVVVTGSSGLLGSTLVERLAAEGYTVVGFDKSRPPHPPKGRDAARFESPLFAANS